MTSFAPAPAKILGRRVQEAFPGFAKIQPISKVRALIDDTAPDRAPPVTSSSPSGLAAVEHEISRACNEARRERSSVTLIAVSKTFDAEVIKPVIAAGQRVFGDRQRGRRG